MKEFQFNIQLNISSSKKVIPITVLSRNVNIIPFISCEKEDFQKIDLQHSYNNYINKISIGKVLYTIFST